MITGLPVGITQQAAGGTGGGGDADLLSDLTYLWEWDDRASWGSGEGKCEITGVAPTGVTWQPNNGLSDIAGLLNGGIYEGAVDCTSTSTAFRLDSLIGNVHSAATKVTNFGAKQSTVPRSFSWFMWWYPTVDPGSTYAGLIDLGNTTQAWDMFLRGTTEATAPGKLSFVTRHPSGNTILSSSVNWVLNAWNLYCCTFDKDTNEMKLYIGVGGSTYETSTTSTYGIEDAPDSQYTFKMLQLNSAYKGSGRLDQMGLYSGRAINKATFDAIYNGGSGDLHANWT